MKNLTKIILALILTVALFAGCSGKKQAKPPVLKTPEEKAVSVTNDEAKKNVESAIELSNYIKSDGEEATTYAYKSDMINDFDLHYDLKLDADTKINLPYSYPITRSNGWEVESAYNNLMLKPRAMTNVVSKKGGKEVMLYLNNFTENEIRCTNGIITRVKIDIYSKEDGYAKLLDTAPEFKIGNSIDAKTDIKGIIEAIGEPSKITCSIDGDKCTDITLMYQNVAKNDWLKFVLSPDGKKIVSVDYNVEK